MRKPNILYIMCDQFRYDCIRALGNQEIFTPNIDRLVKRGLVFEKCLFNLSGMCPCQIYGQNRPGAGSDRLLPE